MTLAHCQAVRVRAFVFSLAVAFLTGVLPVHAMPVIEVVPADTVFQLGATLALSVTASGEALTYQWQKNGRSLAGETAATLSIANAQVRDAGWYRVVVSDAEGSVTSASAMVTVDAAMGAVRGLRNVSVRTMLLAWEPLQIPVRITGTGTKTLLVRGVGPTLASIGLPGVAPAVRLQWTRVDGTVLASNDAWDGAGADAQRVQSLSANVGAIALSAGSADAAMVMDVEPGRYVLEVLSPAGGTAFGEIYDADVTAPTARLEYFGVKTHGGSGSQGSSVGFVLATDGRDYVARLLGPGLPAQRVVANPALRITESGGPEINTTLLNAGWDAALLPPALMGRVGLPALVEGSADVGAVLSTSSALPSATLEGSNNTAEALLFEVADLVNPTAVLAPELIVAPQSPRDLAIGGTLALGAHVAGAEPLAYVWRKDGEVLEGENAARLVLNNLSHEMNGDYEVTVSNEHGSVVVNVGTVTVPQAATIVSQPIAVAASAGDTVTFSVAAEGSGVIRYQWYKDGKLLLGETNATLTIAAAAPSDVGGYTVEVTNNYGSVTSTAAVLSGEQPRPTHTLTPGNVVATIGDDVTLTLSTNATAPSFQWQRNGFPIEGATGMTLTLSDVAMLDSDVYEVVVRDGPSLSEEIVGARVDVFPATILETAMFDPDRAVRFEGGPTDLYGAMGLPDNSLLVFGRFNEFDGHRTRDIVRITSDGEVDTNFMRAESAPSLNFQGARPHGDGHWLAFTNSQPLPGRWTARLLRIDFNGQQDSDFEISPAMMESLGVTSLQSFAVAPDGSLFVAVRLNVEATGDPVLAVVRLTASGGWDQTFAPVLLDNSGVSLLALADGELLITGALTKANATAVQGAVVLSSSGVVDATRSAAVDLSDLSRDGNLRALAVDDDGGMFLLGRLSEGGGWVLDRLQADGQRTARWAVDSWVDDVRRLADGSWVAIGPFRQFGGEALPRVAWIKTDGSLVGAGSMANNWTVSRLGVTPNGTVHIAGFNPSLNRRFVARHALATATFTELELTWRGLGLVTAVVPLNSGEWLVGGDFDTVNGSTSHNLVRLNQALEVVGTYTAPFAGETTMVTQLNRRADGRIDVLAYNAGIYRLDTTGALDGSFTFDASVLDEQALHLLALPGGRTMASSWFLYFDSADRDTKTATIVDAVGTRDPTYRQPIPENPFTDGVVLPDGGTLTIGSGQVVKRLRSGEVDPNFVPPALGISFFTGVDRAVDGANWFFSFNRMVRLGTDGTVSISNAAAGAFLFDIINGQYAARTLPMPDGGLLVTNYTWVSGWDGSLEQPLAWVQPDLSLKSEFRVMGITDQVTAVALEPTGTFLLGQPGWLRGTTAIVETAPTIVEQPVDIIVRAGDPVELRVALEGQGLSVQWRRHGFPIDGATQATFTIAEAGLRDSGFYDVEVSNSAGAVISERVRLTVYPREITGQQEIDPDWIVEVQRNGGVLRKLAPTAAGGWLLAGDFNEFEGHRTQGVVRLLPNGEVDTDFTAAVRFDGTIHALVERPDGRVLVLGYLTAHTEGGDYAKGVRLTSSGAVDPTFRVSADASGNWESVEVAADGRIYVGGQMQQPNTPNYRLVFRLEADGALDPNYRPLESNSDWVSRIRLNPNGEVIALYTSGDFARPESWLVKIGTNGAINESFTVDLRMFEYVSRFDVDDSGRIYAFGPAAGGANWEWWQRFSATGEVDPDFSGPADDVEFVEAMALQVLADGTLFVVNNRYRLVRISANGSVREEISHFPGAALPLWDLAVRLDGRSFMVGGLEYAGEILGSLIEVSPSLAITAVRNPAMASPGIVHAIVPTVDGGYLLGGDFDEVAGEAASFLAKVTAAGELDAGFAANGAPDSAVRQIVAEGSGNWLVSGGFWVVDGETHLGVFRLLADGTVDPTYRTSRFWSALASFDDKLFIEPLADGAALVGGSFSAPGGLPVEQRIFRLRSDGSVDPDFTPSLFASGGTVMDAMEQTDGGILVALWPFDAAGGPTLARLEPDGTVDPNYVAAGNTSNISVYRLAPSDEDAVWALRVPYVERRFDGGERDRNFALGVLLIDLEEGSYDGLLTLLPEAGGRLVIAGPFRIANRGNPVGAGLVRLLANGSLDDTFHLSWTGGRIETAAANDDGTYIIASRGQVWRTRPLQAPQVDSAGEVRLVADGESFTLRPAVAGWPTHWKWYRNGVAIDGANGPTLDLVDFDATKAGVYTLVAGNDAGRNHSGAFVLQVVPVETAVVIASHFSLATGAGNAATPETYEIGNAMVLSGEPSTVTWSVLLPAGWTVTPLEHDGVATVPEAGASELAEWTWTSPGVTELSFAYRLVPPETARGRFEVDAMLAANVGGQSIEGLAEPAPLVIRRGRLHDADTDGDSRLSLTELLRVIELYNTRSGTTRTGRYEPSAETVDGYRPVATSGSAGTLLRHHAADTNRDGALSLSELLRVIELYNTRAGTLRTGAYRAATGTEDGFAPNVN